MAADLHQFDVIVLGGGAAGLMCAAVAGQHGRRVALLEHNGQVGRKILISGGGRCNFTNLHCGPGNFISENKHFAKSALAGYGPRDFLELVERYGIRWHEKTLGQLFCDGSARQIVEMLLAECARGGVEVVVEARGIEVERGAGRFRVRCSAGEFEGESLVVATGGLSIPKMGATGLGYELAGQFGLKVVATRPGLVPLVLGGAEKGWTELAGVSAEVVAWVGLVRGGIGFREKMLATHRGVSGPAVLQAITVEDRSFERAKNGTDFVREYIFPGGCLPSIEAISRSLRRSTPLTVVDVEDIGRHYAETLRRWDANVVARADEVTALGLDTRFQRLWHFYLCYCEGAFLERHISDIQMVMAMPDWEAPMSVRDAPTR